MSEIYALDLGTTKFCIATISYHGHDPIIKKTVVPAKGMRRGMLDNIELATQALNNLLELAEKDFGRDIREVVVGIAGSHLRGRIGKGMIDMGGDVVTAEDELEVLELCANKVTSQKFEILHNIPLYYQIDNRELVESAVSFSGDYLNCESFIIEADRNYMKDIVRLCNHCGLSVKKLYAEPYASASVTVSHALKQAGVVAADIGGGTTDGIVFKNGKPIRLFTVNIGGEMFTKDLSIGLNILESKAHELKHELGLTMISGGRELVSITGKKIYVENKDVYHILRSRTTELHEKVNLSLRGIKPLLRGGIVLTGGGSELAGLTPLMAQLFELESSKIEPEIPKLNIQTGGDGSETQRIKTQTKFATLAGLLYLAISDFGSLQSKDHKMNPTKILKSFVNWLKEIA